MNPCGQAQLHDKIKFKCLTQDCKNNAMLGLQMWLAEVTSVSLLPQLDHDCQQGLLSSRLPRFKTLRLALKLGTGHAEQVEHKVARHCHQRMGQTFGFPELFVVSVKRAGTTTTANDTARQTVMVVHV